MYPLDVTMPQAGCCVAGGLELGAGLIHESISVRGHRPAPGVRLVSVPPIQTCYCTPGAKRVWDVALLGREGSMLGCVFVSCIMPWRSSFLCHRMCCGANNLLWSAPFAFRVADLIGIDGLVSFLYTKTKK